MRRFSLAAVLLAALFVAAPAEAQTKKAAAAPAVTTASSGVSPADNMVSAFLLASYRYSYGTGVGLGVRYQKIVVPQGFIPWKNGMRDELGVEGGIDYAHYSDSYGYFGYNVDVTYNRFDVVAGATWNIWLKENLAVYPKLDVGFGFGSASVETSFGESTDLDPDEDLLVFDGSVGVLYRWNAINLRAELGTGMLRLGAGFNF